jgi:hypothetical protein
VHEFEKSKKSIKLQKYFTSKSIEKETRKQSEASISASATNRFKLGETDNDYDVKEGLECYV